MKSVYPNRYVHARVLVCYLALVKVMKTSGERVRKARCHRLRIWSSLGEDVSCYLRWLMEVGGEWYARVCFDVVLLLEMRRCGCLCAMYGL
jgi:hypothetical protein